MPFADVVNPVKIEIKADLTARLDNYLRRMCIVSTGDSNLNVGSSKIVSPNDYQDYLQDATQNTELKNKLAGFFAYAGNKPCEILEVGAFNANSNTISTQVDVLGSFINSGITRCYMYLVPDAWYYPPQGEGVDKTLPYLIVKPAIISAPEGTEVDVEIDTAGTIDVTISDETKATFDTATRKLTLIAETTDPITVTIKSDTGGTEYSAEIVVNVTAAGTDTETSGESTYGSPLGRDLAFSNLVNQFNTVDKDTYFVVKGEKQDPNISEGWLLYKGSKAAFVVYDNTTSTYQFPLTSLFLGVMANEQYDISDTQKGTPLNNKSIAGAKLDPIGNVLANNLIQAPVNFAGDFAGNNVVLNGRYADGKPWEFYYQNDLMIFKIQEALQTLLLNSANNGNYAVRYNQNGIDVIAATIKSTLNNLKELGVITEYASGKSSATGELENIGYINAIDFYTYKQNNPLDYENEVYKGISFYALIGRYIKEINLAITIG